MLRSVAVDAPENGIVVRGPALQLRLPADTWVDIEAAANSVDEAEGALRGGDIARAWSLANVAVAIAQRPLLPDEAGDWIQARRAKLHTMRFRGLLCLTDITARNGESELAVKYANELIDLEPFHEGAYQRLMRLHANMGNRGEALRAFARCRELLRDELGTSPSPATEALFMSILTAT